MVYLEWLVIAMIVASVGLVLLAARRAGNEYAPGVEISEDDLAEAIQPEVLDFIREQNGVVK